MEQWEVVLRAAGYVPGDPHPPVSKTRVRDAELEAEGALLAREEREPPGIVPLSRERPSMRRKLERHNVRKPGLVIARARAQRLPVALVVAVLEQETGIPQRNIFGCDWGPQGGNPPYCQDRVTNRRVRRMQGSGKPNGVGWPQLTWPPFVVAAQHLRGGARRPRNQLIVGCRVLRDDIDAAGSIWGGLRMYNGSSAYANEVLARYHRWHSALT